jgi:hypothetical protein
MNGEQTVGSRVIVQEVTQSAHLRLESHTTVAASDLHMLSCALRPARGASCTEYGMNLCNQALVLYVNRLLDSGWIVPEALATAGTVNGCHRVPPCGIVPLASWHGVVQSMGASLPGSLPDCGSQLFTNTPAGTATSGTVPVTGRVWVIIFGCSRTHQRC